LPSVNKLYNEFKGQGLEVLLINFREDQELVRRTARERRYTAPVLLDETGEMTGKVYGVWGPPTLYFVDRDGNLVGRVVGFRGWDRPEAREFIRALLEADSKP
jgi:peroxiredoxin